MKILIVGLFEFKYYEEEFGQALIQSGHDVSFQKVKLLRSNLAGKIEYHFSFSGPVTFIENLKILRKALNIKPDIILFWRGTYILRSTLKKLKTKLPETTLVSYNNDDPFGPLYEKGNIHLRNLWSGFINTIPLYDINFVYREINIKDYENNGSRRTKLMLPGFNKSNVADLNISPEYDQDVAFIGHEEPFRLEVINYLLNNNINVKVFGHWDRNKLSPNYKYGAIKPVYGSEYFRIINRSKLTLCFFSRLNRDEYTRRTFEIPAAFGCICSEETDSMKKMFEKNKEAIYFNDKEGCLKIVNKTIEDNEKRNSISTSGNKKVYSLGAEMQDRANQWLLEVKTTV